MSLLEIKNLSHYLWNAIRATFVWPWKMVSVSVRYLFYQPMNRNIKHGLFVFPPKKPLIWRRRCSIGQSSYSMTSIGSIDWFLESSRAKKLFQPSILLTTQKPSTRVFIRAMNWSNRSIYVHLLFLFCSRVFHSKFMQKSLSWCENTFYWALFRKDGI